MDLDTALIALNGIVYVSFIIGAVSFVRASPRQEDVSSFRMLGELLRSRFPDLPAGFTLREGLARAKQDQPELNWRSIEQELAAYEGFRYGGLPESGASGPALSKLVASLRRRTT